VEVSYVDSRRYVKEITLWIEREELDARVDAYMRETMRERERERKGGGGERDYGEVVCASCRDPFTASAKMGQTRSRAQLSRSAFLLLTASMGAVNSGYHVNIRS